MVQRAEILSSRSEAVLSEAGDVLAEVLGAVHLRSSLYSTATLHAPWGMRFAGAPGAVFHVVYEGEAWLRADGVHHLQVGDVAVVRPGLAHSVTDRPGTPADFDVNIGDPSGAFRRGTYGDPAQPRTVLLCGLFRWQDRARVPALALLPGVLHLCAAGGEVDGALGAVLGLLCHEAAQPRPGRDITLQRLADILFIQILRGWVERGDADTGWLGALRDPRLGRALGALHGDPARAWTVAELAGVAGLSRTAFATRFSAQVGEPPRGYLTRWRLHLAAGRLRETRLPVGTVAAEVGYQSEASFSHAFTRVYGEPPGAYRRQAQR